MNQSILDADNPLFEKTEPVLLDIWCRGILEAKNSAIVGNSFLAFALEPFAWVMIAIHRLIHLTILLAAFVFLSGYLDSILPGLAILALVLGIVGIFYKNIYLRSQIILIRIAIILTVGGLVRWIADGYLSKDIFRQQFLLSEPFKQVIGGLSGNLPRTFQKEYDQFMDLYLDSGDKQNAEQLDAQIDKYWMELGKE